MSQTSSNNVEQKLQERISEFVKDPLGFVRYAYPWGEAGKALENETGPDHWQEDVLRDIGHGLKHGWVINNGIKKDCTSGIFIAIASGHGIGKSALMAMIDQWFMSTHPNPAIITTANTDTQLKTKTWREMSKWHKRLINAHWFLWTATKFICKAAMQTWVSNAIPWSESNPEGFAGTHEKYVLIKYDEASAIPSIIWETTEGAMTEADGVKIWITFGNPTQNTGRFKDCFGKDRSRWITYNIDARDSKRTDKKLFDTWGKLYGEDSDFFRVRVKGQFPRAGTKQFIPSDIVEAAQGKVYHPSVYLKATRILSIDIARYGDDKTVFIKKQGKVSFGMQKFRNLDTVTCAGRIAEEINSYKPDVTILDMGNTGAAVYDILDSWGYDITPVWYGSSADDSNTYYNKRTEMWGRMRDWLKNGGAIPEDSELYDDLIGPEYTFSMKEQFQLERKKDMKVRGQASPDCGDALAQCFAFTVVEKASRDHHIKVNQPAKTDYELFPQAQAQGANQAKTDYSIFEGVN